MTKQEIYHNKFLVKEVPDVNQLQVLLKLFPEEKSDWGKTSDNPNTTIEVVLNIQMEIGIGKNFLLIRI